MRRLSAMGREMARSFGIDVSLPCMLKRVFQVMYDQQTRGAGSHIMKEGTSYENLAPQRGKPCSGDRSRSPNCIPVSHSRLISSQTQCVNLCNTNAYTLSPSPSLIPQPHPNSSSYSEHLCDLLARRTSNRGSTVQLVSCDTAFSAITAKRAKLGVTPDNTVQSRSG